MELALLAIVFLFGAIGAFGSRTTKLVLKKLTSRETPSSEATPIIELVGRQQGLISFLLTLLGVSPVTDFTLTRNEVCFNSISLFGRCNQAVPLRNVSSVAAGVQKPISYLIFAGLFVIGGLLGSLRVLWEDGFFNFLGMLVFSFVIAAFFGWLYAINKRFFISIYSQGGPPIMLSFKPNVIEGVKLDLEDALRLVKTVRERVLASTLDSSRDEFRGGSTAYPDGEALSPPAHPRATDFPRAPLVAFESVSGPSPQEPATLLQQARDLIKQGQRESAISSLREIVARFPRTPEATLAKSTLEKAGIAS